MARGRKPASLTPAGRGNNRDRIWAQIRADRQGMTVRALADALRIHQTTVLSYLRGLTAAGYLEQTDGGVYALIRDTGVEAPRVTCSGATVTQGAAREQMWRTMRILGPFTAVDLAAMASTDEHPVAVTDADSYARHLCRAGYLTQVDQRPVRWSMPRHAWTGPRPPVVQRTKVVWDANRGAIAWHDEVTE